MGTSIGDSHPVASPEMTKKGVQRVSPVKHSQLRLAAPRHMTKPAQLEAEMELARRQFEVQMRLADAEVQLQRAGEVPGEPCRARSATGINGAFVEGGLCREQVCAAG